MRKKRILILTALVLLLCCAFSTTAFAAGTGDVAGAVESTWQTASGQIKTVVPITQTNSRDSTSAAQRRLHFVLFIDSSVSIVVLWEQYATPPRDSPGW